MDQFAAIMSYAARSPTSPLPAGVTMYTWPWESRYWVTSRAKSLIWAFLFMCLGGSITIFVISTDKSLVCPRYPTTHPPHLPRLVHAGTAMSSVTDTAANASAAASIKLTVEAIEGEWPPLELNFRENKDILTFIHIQKTGGSDFLSHVVSVRDKKSHERLCYPPSDRLRRRARKKRNFFVCSVSTRNKRRLDANPLPEMWLASEKTYGWVCGLHPFLSEMKKCMPVFLSDNFGYRQRTMHYFTVLRHPISRFISEYMHVRRGATWAYGHQCNGKMITEEQVPACYPGYYQGKFWSNVSLEKFMECPYNWALNRQTVMLADLDGIGCFNRTVASTKERGQRMLQSAKRNLQKMSFFALSEYMVESGLLFEHRFKVKFSIPNKQKKLEYQHSAPLMHQIWSNSTLYNRIAELNHLDMELYEYAVTLFSERLASLGVEMDTNKLDKQVKALGVSASVSYLRRYYTLKEKGILL